jgi:carboxypeptidase Q
MLRHRIAAGFLGLAALLLPGEAVCTRDEHEAAVRILAASRSDAKAWEKLAWLTDRIGPRLSGSAGYEAAVKWAVSQLERDGADRVSTEKVMVPHWVRGAETAAIVSPVVSPMAVTALGLSDPTPEEGIAGEVIEVRSLEELEASAAKVKGRIVLYNRQVLPNGGEEHGYGAAAALRHDGAVEAAKLGAAGALIRSLGTAAFRLPHTGMTEREEGVPRVPFAAISEEDADHIHRLLAAGETVRVRYTLGCKNLPDVESENVLAEIRGSELPDEVVLIGAHLDSWDLGAGAIDDGAGCAVVMDTLRLLKSLSQRPRRTIRAVLFANEENGLKGGHAYAEAHRDELPRHVAAIEMDSGGTKPTGFGVSAGPGGIEAVRRITAPLAEMGAAEVTKGGGGADISPMRAGRVPMIGLRQDTTHYFDYHHTAADTLDKVRPEELAACEGALAVLAYGLANAPDALPRLEPPAEKPPPPPRTSK